MLAAFPVMDEFYDIDEDQKDSRLKCKGVGISCHGGQASPVVYVHLCIEHICIESQDQNSYRIHERHFLEKSSKTAKSSAIEDAATHVNYI